MHSPDHNTRNIVQSHVRHRGHDPSGSRRTTHQATTIRCIPQQRRLVGRTRPHQRASWKEKNPRSSMQALGNKKIQHEGSTKKLPQGWPRLEDAKRPQEVERQVLVKLGRNVSDPRGRRKGSVPPLSGKIVLRTWNATHLKFYFSWTINKIHALFPRPVAAAVKGVLKKRFHQTV